MKNIHNSTSANALKVFKYILQKDKFTVPEIISFLAADGLSVEPETILKYIRTFKKAGFAFEKIGRKKYKLSSIPIQLSNSEINLLKKVTEILNNNFAPADIKLAEKFLRFFDINMVQKTENSFDKNSISLQHKLKKYLKDNLRLEISFSKQNKKQRKVIFELKELLTDKEKILLKGYSVTERTSAIYDFAKIYSIVQTPVTSRFLFGDKDAVVKFYSRIAKSYILKDGEQILDITDDTLIVKTKYYDEEMFFKKILRYADGCEILEPQGLREKYLKYIKNLYQMYDCRNQINC